MKRRKAPGVSLAQRWCARVVGQDAALQALTPYIDIHEAGLAPAGRPAGVFLLLGPTGTGKTRTVEALAEVLHGDPEKLLTIDCAEYQLEHEVAKLIGAPPGHVGHTETEPRITQQQLNNVASKQCPLALVLFDEIEKAHQSLLRLLLGVLDKGRLSLGTNESVDLRETLIFMTSNLGAQEMGELLEQRGIGFTRPAPADPGSRLDDVALAAVRRKFAPEFCNRIDKVATFRPLDAKALETILELELAALQRHIMAQLGQYAFYLHATPRAKAFLLREGTSTRYGARELKRTIHRHVTHGLAALVNAGEITPYRTVRIEERGGALALKPTDV